MKLILLFFLITSQCYATTITSTTVINGGAGFSSINGGTIGTDTSTPTYHFKLEQAYETTKVYEEISASNVGSGADTVTFVSGQTGNAARADLSSESVEVSAETYIGSAIVTLDFYFQTATDDADNRVIHFDAAGDDLWFYPYFSGGNGRLYVATNYNAATISFTAPSTGSFHRATIVLDFANATAADRIKLWINSVAVDTSGVDMSSIVDWGSLTGNLKFPFLNGVGTATDIDELKIYDTVVEP